MVMNPINGSFTSGFGPDSGIEKGRRYTVIDFGRFECSSDGSGGVAYKKITPGFRGRIIGFTCLTETICADTNADGTLQVRIAGTAVTQATPVTIGDLNDGTNPMDTADRTFQGTRISALDKFGPASIIDLLWTTTNAFSDGAIRPLLLCEVYES